MAKKKQLTPEEIVKSFKDEFKTKVKNTRIEKYVAGSKKNEFFHIWMHVDRSVFKEAVKHLMTMDRHAHFPVSSGYDLGETINIVYHFSIYHGERGNVISINMTVELPKSDPTIDTITDLIPGALIAEQEKQEMLGIKVVGIPKDKRVFISEDFPEGVYPWRRDKTGPEKMVRNLHEVTK
jgi:membrane-bound hydrogenase subunit beta